MSSLSSAFRSNCRTAAQLLSDERELIPTALLTLRVCTAEILVKIRVRLTLYTAAFISPRYGFH
jgi:hypothetical protein